MLFLFFIAYTYINYLHYDDINYLLIFAFIVGFQCILFVELLLATNYLSLFTSKIVGYLIFFLFFLFFFIQFSFFILINFIDKDEEVIWHLFISNLFSYFQLVFMFIAAWDVTYIRGGWCKYWYISQFKLFFKVRRWFFIKLFSYFYIFLSLFIFILIFYFILFFDSINYLAVMLWLKFLIKFFFYYSFIIYALYHMLISFFFTDLNYRSFFSFFTMPTNYSVSFTDSYTLSKSFISVREGSNRGNSLKFDPLYLSLRYLGFTYFLKKNPSWKKYWFTSNSRRFWNRYYLPFWWLYYDNFVFDELMYTDFYKFKQFISYYWYKFFDCFLPIYIFDDKQAINDKHDIRLSKFYTMDLKNNFK